MTEPTPSETTQPRLTHAGSALTLKPAAVAEMLDVHVSTVRRSIREGVIPTVPGTGATYRVPRAWVERHTGDYAG